VAAGAAPGRKPSKLVEQAAMVSFSMFISNEVVRIAWFGLAEAFADKLALGDAWRWGLWGLGVLAAFVFAFGLHYLIDQPIQNRIRAWLKARGREKPVSQPVVSLEG
jgi:peptidoglycan/LPS O-acetylase OafA/YrhL